MLTGLLVLPVINVVSYGASSRLSSRLSRRIHEIDKDAAFELLSKVAAKAIDSGFVSLSAGRMRRINIQVAERKADGLTGIVSVDQLKDGKFESNRR